MHFSPQPGDHTIGSGGQKLGRRCYFQNLAHNVSDMSLDESGSNSAKVAATSLLLRVTRGSSDAYFNIPIIPDPVYAVIYLRIRCFFVPL